MRTLKIFILKLCLLLLVFPDEGNAQSFCETPQTVSPSKKRVRSSSSAAARMQDDGTGSFYLRVYVHVIRKSDGSGGRSSQDVNTAMNFLSQDFNPHDIYFKWDGSIDYIDSDTLYDSKSTEIYDINNHENGIDIYFYDENVSAGGRANGVGESSEFYIGGVWSGYGPTDSSRVFSHEMGHVINLFHTHHGTAWWEDSCPDCCPELVDGSNSDTCGDFVEDTPADPGLREPYGGSQVNDSCEYTGNDTDANDDVYQPDESIIMSYAPPKCLSYFTNGEGQRMRESIKMLPHLQKTWVSGNCPFTVNVSQDVQSGQYDVRNAEESIAVYNTVESDGFAKYSGGSVAKLSPGFDAKKGSNVDVKTAACISGSSSSSSRVASAGDDGSTIEDNESALTIYPNPVSDYLNIEYKGSDKYEVRIYDQLGNTVRSVYKNGKNQRINTSNLSSGLYYLKLVSEDNATETKKFVVK